MHKSAFFLLGITTIACFPARELTVTAADLNDPTKTHMTNMLASARGPEEPPQGISRSVLMDEATVTSQAGKTCVTLTMRTGGTLDVPLSEWDATLNEQPLRFGKELVTVRDYPFTGDREVVVAERVTAHSISQMRIAQPFEGNLRVFERTATACDSHPRIGDAIDFKIAMYHGQLQWFERFVWKVR